VIFPTTLLADFDPRPSGPGAFILPVTTKRCLPIGWDQWRSQGGHWCMPPVAVKRPLCIQYMSPASGGFPQTPTGALPLDPAGASVPRPPVLSPPP